MPDGDIQCLDLLAMEGAAIDVPDIGRRSLQGPGETARIVECAPKSKLKTWEVLPKDAQGAEA